MREVSAGDEVRVMQPTRVARGFIDCSTVLHVISLEPFTVYWVTRDGRKVLVDLPPHIAVDVIDHAGDAIRKDA